MTQVRGTSFYLRGKSNTGNEKVATIYAIQELENDAWVIASDENGPLLFDTEKERNAKLVEMQQ